MDFLKANPFMTMEDYWWGYSAAMIRIMAYDATRTIYLSEKQSKRIVEQKKVTKYDDPMSFMNDLGLPVLNNI